MSSGTPDGPFTSNPFGVGGSSGGSGRSAYEPTRPLRGSGSPFDETNATEPFGGGGAPGGGGGFGGGGPHTAPGSARPPRRPRRRGPVIAAACLLGGALLVVGADFAARAIAESQIAEGVEQSLPEGVTGGVAAHLHGFSALWQLATGVAEHVELESDGLAVLDVPVQARLDLHGVSFRGDARAASASATASIPESLVNRAAELPGGGWLSLGDGEASYRFEGSWLGATGSAEVFAKPSVDAAGQVVTFDPERASLQATVLGQQLQIEPPLDALPGVDVCAAQYLPQGVRITAITVAPGTAEISLQASDVPFTQDWADSRGACG